MKLTFPSLRTLLHRPARQDPGMSFRRAYWHWYCALIAGACVTCVTGAVAYVEFTSALHDETILTEPIATTHYNAEHINEALARYDARRAAYRAPELSVPEPQPEPTVATPSEIRVE